jgi:hypothetical protein
MSKAGNCCGLAGGKLSGGGHCGGNVLRDRLTQAKSLAIPATELSQQMQLLRGFDMLGNAIVPRGAAQFEHTPEQGKARIHIGHGRDQGTVEFDRVELDLSQIAD